MAAPRRHFFMKKPEFQKTASKEPAKVEEALKQIAQELEEEDEEYMPASHSVSCFVVLYFCFQDSDGEAVGEIAETSKAVKELIDSAQPHLPLPKPLALPETKEAKTRGTRA